MSKRGISGGGETMETLHQFVADGLLARSRSFYAGGPNQAGGAPIFLFAPSHSGRESED